MFVKYMPLEELKKMNSKEVELDPNMNYKNIVRIIKLILCL